MHKAALAVDKASTETGRVCMSERIFTVGAVAACGKPEGLVHEAWSEISRRSLGTKTLYLGA